MAEKKTIIVGLGNPLLGDDGVGWRVAGRLKEQAGLAGVEIDALATGGLSLMEHLVGFDRAIIVDASDLGDVEIGSVRQFRLDDLPDPNAGHLGSSHETNLQTALRIGRLSGALLPEEVIVVAVESPHVYDFSDTLSPKLEEAVPRAVELILSLLAIISP